MPRLIAVDWGTSALRGALLDEAGRVIEEKSAPLGILNVSGGDFAGGIAVEITTLICEIVGDMPGAFSFVIALLKSMSERIPILPAISCMSVTSMLTPTST